MLMKSKYFYEQVSDLL